MSVPQAVELPHRPTLGDAVPLAAILAVAAVFVYGWTDFGWHQYLAIRLPVFDFGINYQIIWAAAHGTDLDLFGVGVGSLVVYLFVPVLWAAGSAPTFFLFLVGFEAAWLAAGAVPLFLVARERLRSRWGALAIALAYLLYPALTGPVWFPFHFEALFPTLFLFGYWLYRRGSYWGAGAFWTAALFTHVGAVIVLGFFAAGVILEPYLPGAFARLARLGRPTVPPPQDAAGAARSLRRRSVFGLCLFVAAVVSFLFVASFYGWFWFLHYVTKSGPSATALSQPFYSAPSVGNLPIQGLTILFLFGPLLGLPFLGREERWGLIPYLAVLLLTGQHGFWFPFRNQYPALLVGPLFASAVRGIERVQEWRDRPRPAESPVVRPGRRWRRVARSARFGPVASGVIMVAVLTSGLFLAPWGPFNGSLRFHSLTAPGVYNDNVDFGTNLTLDAQLRSLAYSVPPGGVVLTQTELVEPLSREYYMVPSRYATNVPLDYVVTDPYNPSFYGHNLNGPYNASMFEWANYFLAQGWGVLGEVDGAVLLSADYAGAPTTFVPVDQSFAAASLPCCGDPATPWNGSTRGTWVAGPATPYDGSYNVFGPGVYSLTLTLVVQHPRPTDRIVCQVSGAHGAMPLATVPITGAAWGSSNGTVRVTIPFEASQYVLGPRVSLHVVRWTGALEFVGMRILQVGPPPYLAASGA